MEYPTFLDKSTSKALEFDTVSDEIAVHLACLIDKRMQGCDFNSILTRKNRIANRSRLLKGGPVYVLKPDDMGEYASEEMVWHEGVFGNVFRELDASQFAELACWCIIWNELTLNELNDILENESASFRFSSDVDGNPTAYLLEDEIIDEENPEREPSLSILSNRMRRAFSEKDWGGLIHAAASFYEAVLKTISTDKKKTDGKTLDGLIKCKACFPLSLPDHLWEQMDELYVKRNRFPLAGHGTRTVSDEEELEMDLLLETTLANGRVILRGWRKERI